MYMRISYRHIAEAANISLSTVQKDGARRLFQPDDLYSISQYIVAVRFFRDKDIVKKPQRKDKEK